MSGTTTETEAELCKRFGVQDLKQEVIILFPSRLKSTPEYKESMEAFRNGLISMEAFRNAMMSQQNPDEQVKNEKATLLKTAL